MAMIRISTKYSIELKKGCFIAHEHEEGEGNICHVQAFPSLIDIHAELTEVGESGESIMRAAAELLDMADA